MGPGGGAGSIQAHSETQSPASWLCRGTVSRIIRGGVNADVVINLPGGVTISAIITLDSLEHYQGISVFITPRGMGGLPCRMRQIVMGAESLV